MIHAVTSKKEIYVDAICEGVGKLCAWGDNKGLVLRGMKIVQFDKYLGMQGKFE